MSDTERLEEAAAQLDRRADWSGPKQRDEDRAVAALLRHVSEGSTPTSHVFEAALAVADAVLGVPATPKTP